MNTISAQYAVNNYNTKPNSAIKFTGKKLPMTPYEKGKSTAKKVLAAKAQMSLKETLQEIITSLLDALFY